jgi:hypothetical protein
VIFKHALSSSPTEERAGEKNDLFSAEDDGSNQVTSPVTNPTLRVPQSFEELPIELRSLTERYG